jgi:hypothetical protein
MNEVYAALLSWAVTLTGYAPPQSLPEIKHVDHAYLETVACAGRQCKVMGWYPPGHTIFLDDRLDAENSLYASSIVVHEMVHYLQQASGRWSTTYTCKDAMAMEREAYAAQQAYLVNYGVYQPVGLSVHNAGCILAAEHE